VALYIDHFSVAPTLPITDEFVVRLQFNTSKLSTQQRDAYLHSEKGLIMDL
jgi:hypothetical protein